MKILYFDTETTGLDAKIHEITQIAMIIEIDGEVRHEVDLKMRPERWDVISPEALETTGIGIDTLKTYPERNQTYRQIVSIFDEFINKYDRNDKFYPAGHNVQFDLDFLQFFFRSQGETYGCGSYQNWRALDTRILANFLIAKGKLQVPDVKLGTLCRHLGIEIQAHDALSDIRATRELNKKMMEMI